MAMLSTNFIEAKGTRLHYTNDNEVDNAYLVDMYQTERNKHALLVVIGRKTDTGAEVFNLSFDCKDEVDVLSIITIGDSGDDEIYTPTEFMKKMFELGVLVVYSIINIDHSKEDRITRKTIVNSRYLQEMTTTSRNTKKVDFPVFIVNNEFVLDVLELNDSDGKPLMEVFPLQEEKMNGDDYIEF